MYLQFLSISGIVQKIALRNDRDCLKNRTWFFLPLGSSRRSLLVSTRTVGKIVPAVSSSLGDRPEDRTCCQQGSLVLLCTYSIAEQIPTNFLLNSLFALTVFIIYVCSKYAELGLQELFDNKRQRDKVTTY